MRGRLQGTFTRRKVALSYDWYWKPIRDKLYAGSKRKDGK